MFQGATFGARLVAFGGSVALHAALFGATSGRPLRPVGAGSPVGVLSVVEIPVDLERPAPEPPHHHEDAHLVAHITHTHPYPVSPDHDATPHDPSVVHEHVHVENHDHDAPAAPAAVVAATGSAAPTFVIDLGQVRPAAGGATALGGHAEHGGATDDDEPAPEASVDSRAQLASGGALAYPALAAAAGVEAEVPLEIVVDARGAVMSARPLAHVGYGLDEAALRGVRAYRFTPAMRHGRATSVRMRWNVVFRLQ